MSIQTKEHITDYAKIAGIWAVFAAIITLLVNVGAFIATAQANTKTLADHTVNIAELRLLTADVPEIKADVKELLKRVERLDANLSDLSKEPRK